MSSSEEAKTGWLDFSLEPRAAPPRPTPPPLRPVAVEEPRAAAPRPAPQPLRPVAVEEPRAAAPSPAPSRSVAPIRRGNIRYGPHSPLANADVDADVDSDTDTDTSPPLRSPTPPADVDTGSDTSPPTPPRSSAPLKSRPPALLDNIQYDLYPANVDISSPRFSSPLKYRPSAEAVISPPPPRSKPGKARNPDATDARATRIIKDRAQNIKDLEQSVSDFNEYNFIDVSKNPFIEIANKIRSYQSDQPYKNTYGRQLDALYETINEKHRQWKDLNQTFNKIIAITINLREILEDSRSDIFPVDNFTTKIKCLGDAWAHFNSTIPRGSITRKDLIDILSQHWHYFDEWLKILEMDIPEDLRKLEYRIRDKDIDGVKDQIEAINSQTDKVLRYTDRLMHLLKQIDDHYQQIEKAIESFNPIDHIDEDLFPLQNLLDKIPEYIHDQSYASRKAELNGLYEQLQLKYKQWKTAKQIYDRMMGACLVLSRVFNGKDTPYFSANIFNTGMRAVLEQREAFIQYTHNAKIQPQKQTIIDKLQLCMTNIKEWLKFYDNKIAVVLNRIEERLEDFADNNPTQSEWNQLNTEIQELRTNWPVAEIYYARMLQDLGNINIKKKQ